MGGGGDVKCKKSSIINIGKPNIKN